MKKLNEYIQHLDELKQKHRQHPNPTSVGLESKKTRIVTTEQDMRAFCCTGTNDSDTVQVSEDLEAIWERTKQRRSEELKTYKERWSDLFNKTIRNESTLTSHWGKKPFVRAMKMSVSDHWNDIYLAHAYPYLYARKLRYAFASHLWESFLILYGKLGFHLFVLTSLTIIIVAGYRVLAQCHRFAPEGSLLGIFSRQVCALSKACSPLSPFPSLLLAFPTVAAR